MLIGSPRRNVIVTRIVTPSVGPSAGHIIGLIVPANRNLVPSGLGLRSERLFVFDSFVFRSFSSFILSVSFLFALVTNTYINSLLFRVYV